MIEVFFFSKKNQGSHQLKKKKKKGNLKIQNPMNKRSRPQLKETVEDKKGEYIKKGR